MATAAYYHWVSAGKPYTDCRPIARVAANIRRHGYTVYTAGDSHHQLNDPPQDHTGFSATGWPVPSAFGVGHALDIMPPTAAMVARGLPTLAQLAGQIYADRMANARGASWLKYQNWEPDGPTGKCVQDSWQPGHRREASSDRDHIHNSARSDMDDSTVADDYDPVQRWLDRQEETDMPTAAEIAAAVWDTPIPGTETADHPKPRTARQALGDLYQHIPKGKLWPESADQQILDAIHALGGGEPGTGGTAPTAAENAAAVVEALRAHPLAPGA